MALRRMVSRSLWTSRRFAQVLPSLAGPLTEFAQLLFVALINGTDDFGRQSGDAFTVKNAFFPATRTLEDVELALQHLGEAQLIDRYEADGEVVIEVLKFKEHQPGLKQRGGSKFPGPPAGPPAPHGSPRQPPAAAGECRDVPPELNGTEGKGTEENGTEDQNSGASAAPLHNPIGFATGQQSRVAADDGNYAVIRKLVHQVLDGEPLTGPDLTEAVKRQCAGVRIAYDSDVVARAIASVEATRVVRRPTPPPPRERHRRRAS